MGSEARRKRKGRRVAPGRRGMSSVLAMLYLVLFSAIALGFYAQTNLGAQVAGNEERVLEAQVAAESGLQFIRYQLSTVKVLNSAPREDVLENVYDQLSARLDGTLNLGSRIVGAPTPASPSIEIPSGENEFIQFRANGSKFRATITAPRPGIMRIKAVGRAGGGALTRAIAMDFVEVPLRSPVLDYGVATRGPVDLTSGFIHGSPGEARASVLSTETGTATPVSFGGGAAGIGGEVYLTHAAGSVAGSGSIAGVSDPTDRAAHVHPGTAAPEFPTSDPGGFIAYIAGRETMVTGSTSAPYLSNIRVAAGANPTFSGGGTYEGVILIEAPNQVTFAGGSTIRGVIVVADPSESSAGNRIIFSGGSTVYGPETLPESFGALRDMKGTAILAPNFVVEMTGGASALGGSILARGMTVAGAASGSVTGTVLVAGADALGLSGGSALTLVDPGAGASPIPSGMRFTHTYAPYPATYLEVPP